MDTVPFPFVGECATRILLIGRGGGCPEGRGAVVEVPPHLRLPLPRTGVAATYNSTLYGAVLSLPSRCGHLLPNPLVLFFG